MARPDNRQTVDGQAGTAASLPCPKKAVHPDPQAVSGGADRSTDADKTPSYSQHKCFVAPKRLACALPSREAAPCGRRVSSSYPIAFFAVRFSWVEVTWKKAVSQAGQRLGGRYWWSEAMLFRVSRGFKAMGYLKSWLSIFDPCSNIQYIYRYGVNHFQMDNV